MGQVIGNRGSAGGPVFAAQSRARSRWVAAVVTLVVLATLLFVAPLVLGFMFGPSAPALDLPQIERFDAVRADRATSLPHSGPSAMPLVVVAVVVTGLMGWCVTGRMGRRRPVRPIGGARRSRRSGRWWPAALLMILIVSAVSLAVNHYTTGVAAGEGNRDDGGSAFRRDVGSVVDVGPDGVRSAHVRPGTVALTFDDGPDPRWTPAILDVLAEKRVPGTFFVIGEHVARYPELVRRVIRQGGEVGVHSYRHIEVASQPREEFLRDLRLTQLAIVGATGRSTALFRPPFVTRPSNVGLQRYLALLSAGEDGYVTVLADRDSSDWKRPGTDAILRHSTPVGGAGAIIELHDGGGDRAQTVAALGTLIDRLRESGYQFTTVSGAARIPPGAVMPSAGGWEHAWGRGFLVATAVAESWARWLMFGLVLVAAGALLRTVGAAGAGWRHSRRRAVRLRDATPPRVSVIVAAYNEERTIVRTIEALRRSRGVELQIVVVDDGSSDRTATLVAAIPDDRVVLVTGGHGGKAAALAAGLARSDAELIVTVDADTEVEPETVMELTAPFADLNVGAVSGNLRVRRPTGPLGTAQHLEYVVGNAFDRRALDLMAAQVTVPGAAGAYRRDAIEAVGGFSSPTVAEDTDLTLALIAAGWDVRFAPAAVAWTMTPTTVRALWRQRSRWSFGIAQSLWRHRRMIRRARSMPRGAVVWAYLALAQVVFPLLSPLLDFVLIWGLISGSVLPVAVWIGVTLLQLGLMVLALRIEGQSWRALRAYPLLIAGYRHLIAAVVVQTVAWACAGRVPRWGVVYQAPMAAVAQAGDAELEIVVGEPETEAA